METDKKQHILYSGAISFVTGLLMVSSLAICGALCIGTMLSIFIGSCIAGIVAALGKEFGDYAHESPWDWDDVKASTIGSIAGAILVTLLNFIAA